MQIKEETGARILSFFVCFALGPQCEDLLELGRVTLLDGPASSKNWVVGTRLAY